MSAVVELALAHPWSSAFLLTVGGWALAVVVAAPVNAWRKWDRRPYDCPRCSGTGRDP